ncbi:hypothetical protein Bca4012_034367 [Brassica carinata]
MRDFQSKSGLALNIRKTCVFVDGDETASTTLASDFGLVRGSLPVRYLGLPLSPHKLKKQDYQPLIDRIKLRVSSWSTRRLSFAGRLQLLNSVIYNIINFWGSVFPLPKVCLDSLEQICNAFLWTGAPSSARGAKVSWVSVCTSKEARGLRLRRLRDQNMIWKSLMAYRDTARQFITCTVMSGRNALFWLDDWTWMGSLLHLTGPTGPQVSGISITASVFEALTEGRWTTSRNRHPTLSLLRSCMPSLLPSLDSEEPDFFLWRNSPHDPPDIFSASKVWNFLKPIETLVPWFSLVWFKQKIPKHVFIAWLTFRDRLATRDHLSTWGIQVSPDCMLCGDENETRNHLFFDCCFSREV